MKTLNREINLNKKFIVLMILVTIITLGLYSSYALFEISVIQDNIVVIKTGTIDIITEVVGYSDNTITLNSGESKEVAINLSNDLERNVAYKLYYHLNSGDTFSVISAESYENNVVYGTMKGSKTLKFILKNTGSSSLSLTIGAQGGLAGHPIDLNEGVELISEVAKGDDILYTKINSSTTESCTPTIVEDGITYFSGTNDCVNFNYVWYSGKMWRITAIYPDGSMKLVTDQLMTTITYGSNVNFYTNNETKSYVYQWLNEDFLDTLYNYENVIETNYKWNVTQTSDISTKLLEGTIESKVGLLNSYEYYKSYQNTESNNGYLNLTHNWWLINSYSTSNVWLAYNNGIGENRSPIEYQRGVRPAIVLKSDVEFLEITDGTIDNPYKVKGDKENIVPDTTLLNTRTSGEYVKFDNQLYRIVNIENDGSIKINKYSYLKDTSGNFIFKQLTSSNQYGLATNTQTDDYFDYYLNNTWYNGITKKYKDMLVFGTYYLGMVDYPSLNYKSSICETASATISTKDCKKTSRTWEGYVGLQRVGEMFAAQNVKYSSVAAIWLITNLNDNNLYFWMIIAGNNLNQNLNTNRYGIRPSLTLSKDVKVKSGTGLPDKPFEISL